MGKTNYVLSIISVVVVPILLTALYKHLMNGAPASYILPNLSLFLPVPAFTKYLWKNVIKYDTSKVIDPTHIPVIPASEYTIERLREATENYKRPAIVRGLFSDTKGCRKWKEVGYLANSVLADQIVPVVRGAVFDKAQNNRTTELFKNAISEIYSDKNSKLYLFFPVKSRNQLTKMGKAEAERLVQNVNTLVAEDLEIHNKIWSGFGTSAHSTFGGSQLVIGRGTADNTTTGTGWHCAIGNNYFIQVVGKKRWYFLDQKNSAMMQPVRGGMFNINTGSDQTILNNKHMPLLYADVLAGDMLYNPDWMWHSIQNYEGVSIGLPVRELNLSLSFRNNFQYSSIIMSNVLASKVGIDIGGYPPLIVE
jgi:hypothetical protein